MPPRATIPVADTSRVQITLQLPEYAILTAPIRSQVESSICGFHATHSVLTPYTLAAHDHPSFDMIILT